MQIKVKRRLLVDRKYATIANAIVAVGVTPNGTHFEPQRASVRAGRPKSLLNPALVRAGGPKSLLNPALVRAGRPGISRKSGPHASALRLKIYKVRGIGLYASGTAIDSEPSRPLPIVEDGGLLYCGLRGGANLMRSTRRLISSPWRWPVTAVIARMTFSYFKL